MTINKEGFRIIGVTVVLLAAVGAVFWLLGFWILIFALVFLLCGVIAFFRDPRRPVVQDENAVFAPCDGRVVVVERVRAEEYFGGRESLQISIFMSVTNVHVNRFPVGGRVVYYKYHPGKFLVAWHPKSSELNEHTTTVVSTPHGEVLVRQIAGLVARRIVCYAREGVDVGQNSRLGFIKFGSRMDILLPVDAEPAVRCGDHVRGSQTIIAKF